MDGLCAPNYLNDDYDKVEYKTKISPAYLAGVIDSDGSISVSKKHPKRTVPYFFACMQLTWTHTEYSESVILQLVETYGGSYFIGNATKGSLAKRPIIKYLVQVNHLRPLLFDTIPHLILKKRQAQLALEALDINMRYRGGVRRTEEDHKRLEEISKEVKFLNSGKIS